MSYTDISGREYGGLTALCRVPNPKGKYAAYWLCRCHCGNQKAIAYTTLIGGKTRGCGCLQFAGTHGLSYEYRYRMYTNARRSSRTRDIYFDLKPEDITTLELCPILGIELTYGGTGKVKDSSASIDRVDNSLGYVKGNVMIISNRANRIKGDATVEELEAIISYMNKHKENKNYE